MKHSAFFCFFSFLTFIPAISFSIDNQTILTEKQSIISVAKPKYKPEIKLLSNTNDYFRREKAPNFWRLIPYYIEQQTDSSCSVATITTIVNAARVGKHIAANDELATPKAVLKRVNDEEWKKAVSDQGEGITLAELKVLMAKSLQAYDIKNFTIDIIYTKDTSQKTKEKLHNILMQTEKYTNHFIVVNFDQSVFANGISVGHFSPVGAYDAAQKRVLILDPDRQWHEPYWVPEDSLLKAMVTKDIESNNYRGYLWIKIANNV